MSKIEKLITGLVAIGFVAGLVCLGIGYSQHNDWMYWFGFRCEAFIAVLGALHEGNKRSK